MGDLGCEKVPSNFTQVRDLNDIRPCKKCIVRISGPSGPGRLTPSRTGFVIDESPLVMLYYNGIDYTLKETHLLIRGEHGGSHILPGMTTPPVGEVLLFFERADNLPYCVAVPIVAEKGVGNVYFQQLNQVVRNRAAITSIIDPETELLQYTGSELRGRWGSDPKTAFPRRACEGGKKVRYLVCTRPTNILPADLLRLTSALDKNFMGPVTAKTPLTPTDVQTFVTRIPRIVLEGPKKVAKGPASADGVYLTRELQCRRIDTAKDIEGDRVYVGGKERPGDSTLDKELLAASDSQAAYLDTDSKATIQPGTIETILALVLGSIIGFVLLVGAFFFFWKMTGRNYVTKVGTDYPSIFDPFKAFFKGRGSSQSS